MADLDGTITIPLRSTDPDGAEVGSGEENLYIKEDGPNIVLYAKDENNNVRPVGSSGGIVERWESYAEGIRPSDNNEIAVGRYNAGRESCFGEGDSHQEGLTVLEYDSGTGTYTDVSNNALTKGDGNYVQFPSLSAGSAIYIGTSTGVWYSGIKINIIQAIIGGSGSVAKEYYNGSAWVEFTTMATESNFPHQSYGDGIGDTVGDFQLRYNHFLSKDWTPTTVNGVTTYWTRYRIKTAISQTMKFDFVKLHTSRTEINATGFIEFFGWARPVKQFFLMYGSFQAALNSPSNNDIYLSDKLDIGRIENEFQTGTVDRTGFTKILPLDMDTSTPVKLRIKWQVDGGNSGDIKFVVRWGFSKKGDAVYSSTAAPSTAPSEQEIAGIIPVSANSDKIEQITDVYLDVSSAIPERGVDDAESIWISFERPQTDSQDTLRENAIVNDIECYYLSWRLGGMVNNY